MADEDDRRSVDCFDDLKNVIRIAAQRCVFFAAVLGQVRFSGTNVVEQNNPVVFHKSGGQKAPHDLVAAVTVDEQHRLATVSDDVDVVSLEDRHGEAQRSTSDAPIMAFLIGSAKVRLAYVESNAPRKVRTMRSSPCACVPSAHEGR